MLKFATLAALGLVVSGCATVTRGTTEQVTINSEPAGAEAVSSAGLICPLTPCTWEVSRKSEFVVTFKKQGYQTQQAQVGTKVAGAGAAGFAGNVLLGGLIGMGVDASTGATLEHFPNPVFVTLLPEGKAPARAARTRKRAAPKPAVVDAPAAAPQS